MSFIGIATSFLVLTYGIAGQGTTSLQTTTIPMAPIVDTSGSSAKFVDLTKRESMAKYLREIPSMAKHPSGNGR